MFDISSMYELAESLETEESFGTGWLPSIVGASGYAVENPRVREIVSMDVRRE